MIELPALFITHGVPGTYEFTVAGDNFTGWTGSVTVRAKWADDALFTLTPTMDALGNVVFSWTAAQASLLPAKERVGHFKAGLFQVALTAANEAATFQGDVMVAGAL